MRAQTSDPYERLLAEWQARRELVDAYHRALRFLTLDIGAAPQRQRERRQQLHEKLLIALKALRQASDQLRRFEQGRAPASSR